MKCLGAVDSEYVESGAKRERLGYGKPGVSLISVRVEADKNHPFRQRIFQTMVFDLGKGYPGRSVDRKAVNSGADGRKGDGLDVLLLGQ